MKKILSILRYTWELPQNIAALIYYNYLMDNGLVMSSYYYKGSRVFVKFQKGSVTLGNNIFLSSRAAKGVVDHEFGHTRQSLMLGPLYLIIIGLPSIIWTMTHKYIAPGKDSYDFFTERWANKLGGVE